MDISTLLDAATEVDDAADEAYDSVARIACDRFGLQRYEFGDDAADEMCDALRTFYQACARIALARIEAEDETDA